MKKPLHERENQSRKLTSLTKTQKGIAKIDIFFGLSEWPQKRQFRRSVEKQKPKTNTKKLFFENSTTMKNMNNFAAQQLSKKQMNEVKGGRICTAILKTTQQKVSITVPDGNAVEEIVTAGGMIENKYGDIATNIKCR